MDKNYFNRDQAVYGSIRIPAHNSSSLFFSASFFDRLLKSSGQNEETGSRLGGLQYSMMITGFLLLGVASYIGLSSDHSKLSGNQSIGTTNIASIGGGSGQGTSSEAAATSPAPSTTPVSSSDLASYTVAPNLPRYLIIPSINVDARVLSVGVTSGGDIATPDNIYDTAWYNGSAEPGQPGAEVIDGHISSWSAKGVFYNLNRLVPGDLIQVERGDGIMFTYKVVKSQVYPSGNVNMAAALSPVVAGQPGLNLITCAGQVVAGTNEFNERLVVFAVQVSP